MLATESPAPRSPRGRPSIASPVSWLSRASIISHRSEKHSPVNISDPTICTDARGSIASRYGTLGNGAIRVNTPQEALARAIGVETALLEEDEENASFSDKSNGTSSGTHSDGSEPATPPPEPVSLYNKRNSASVKSSSLPPSPRTTIVHDMDVFGSSQPISSPPPLPTDFSLSSPPPHFIPILLSPFDAASVDSPQTVIVSLETETQSFQTTLATLISRPSHLSRYIQELLQDSTKVQTHDSNAARSPSGLDRPHIFLDRPSAPYYHILTYLRSAASQAPSLPRGVKLSYASSYERYESLLALRDEARYLDLNELYRLCCDELTSHPSCSSSTRPHSQGSSTLIIHPYQNAKHIPESRSLPTTPIHSQRRTSRGSSDGSTAVESPRITSRILAEQYIPSAHALKQRSRSDSRSDTPRVQPQGGWL